MALNVLVVDDSAVMRAMVVKSLRMCGVALGEVHEAGDGEEALHTLDDHWVDAALIDINMRGMDGETLLRRLRAAPDTAELPVIIVSTESGEARVESLRALGAEFVHKPFTPEQLGDALARVTRWTP
jgi:two-component system, chemotaxis family, chemotaxis protein CheY